MTLESIFSLMRQRKADNEQVVECNMGFFGKAPYFRTLLTAAFYTNDRRHIIGAYAEKMIMNGSEIEVYKLYKTTSRKGMQSIQPLFEGMYLQHYTTAEQLALSVAVGSVCEDAPVDKLREQIDKWRPMTHAQAGKGGLVTGLLSFGV